MIRLPLVVLWLMLLAPAGLFAANSLEVEPRNVRAGEAFEIAVTLEGDAAAADSLNIPLQNAKIDSGPDTSSQFSWVNGVTRREKTFRYAAHAIEPGRAVIGPIRAGAVTLAAVTIDVLPPIAENVSDPEEMLRLLEEAGRSSSFILAESDRAEAVVGQPILVTWNLYTEEVISDLDVASMPALADFWTEELPVTNEPTRDVFVGDRRMRRIPIRRAALFPLRAGGLKVGALVTTAAVMRPFGRRTGPFAILNQEVVNKTLRSPSRTFTVRPVPGGPYEAVGEFSLTCGPPKVAAAGPVSVEVVVQGTGNLRAAAPPRFAIPADARAQVVDGGVTVDKQSSVLTMRRSWTFLLFPSRTGSLAIPELFFRTYTPSRAEARTLRCGASTVLVTAIPATTPSPALPPAPVGKREMRRWPLIVVALVAVLAIMLLLRMKRRSVPREELERVLRQFDQPRVMRAELYELVTARGFDPESLLRESSERGDSFRAVASLIDIAEKETLTGQVSRTDLRKRLSEFLRTIR